jgi:hypothetical protein
MTGSEFMKSERDYDFALLSRDPIRVYPATQITPSFVSLIRSFYFSSVLAKASLIRPSEK